MRAALYARVSTKDKGQNPAVQLGELRQYCESRGWTVAAEYVDLGVSGAKESRPELNRLMADSKTGKMDVVVVYKFDRFARSLRHLHKALDTFNQSHVSFVSKSEQVDTTTPAGRLLFSVIGAVAEFERDVISERVKSGMAYAKSQGKRVGGSKPKPIDESELIRLHAQGRTLRQIAREMDLSAGTVYVRLNQLRDAA